MSTETYRVAAVQMVSTPNLEENLAAADALLIRAAGEGVLLAVLPEYFGIMGREKDKVALREADGRGPMQDFLSQAAKRLKLWIVGGTVPLATEDPSRVRNACLVYAPTGERVARYDKIHLFGFDTDQEHYYEAQTIERGQSIVQFDAPFGKTGLSVCYDLRFPELYRAFGHPTLIVVPSAFTATTGQAHWEVLLRARAIENQCYVLAAGQGGTHSSGRRTHGHSMLIDPWGSIMAQLDQGPGLVVGEIDPARLRSVRQNLPAHAHRVL